MVAFVFLLLLSCESVETDMYMEYDGYPNVRIEYNGITSNSDILQASFTLVNDSTASLQYYAYDIDSPHYSTEVLSDSGWVYLFWNWCGTGADWYPLEAGTSIDFNTTLPSHSCTWRVVLSIVGEPFVLYSNGIQFTAP